MTEMQRQTYIEENTTLSLFNIVLGTEKTDKMDKIQSKEEEHEEEDETKTFPFPLAHLK